MQMKIEIYLTTDRTKCVLRIYQDDKSLAWVEMEKEQVESVTASLMEAAKHILPIKPTEIAN